MSFMQDLKKRVWTDNAVFRLLLGLCPALAVTTSAENGLGMGLASTFVLVCSNCVVSSLRKFNNVRFCKLSKRQRRILKSRSSGLATRTSTEASIQRWTDRMAAKPTEGLTAPASTGGS